MFNEKRWLRSEHDFWGVRVPCSQCKVLLRALRSKYHLKNFGTVEIQARGCWVRSPNATSVLCSPPNKWRWFKPSEMCMELEKVSILFSNYLALQLPRGEKSESGNVPAPFKSFCLTTFFSFSFFSSSFLFWRVWKPKKKKKKGPFWTNCERKKPASLFFQTAKPEISPFIRFVACFLFYFSFIVP